MSNLEYLPQHSRADHPARRRREREREELLAGLAFMAFMLLAFTVAMILYLCSQI